MSFLEEIKRRKVFQVAAVYAVMVWLIIQIIDVVSEPLILPKSLDTSLSFCSRSGFPSPWLLHGNSISRPKGSSVLNQATLPRRSNPKKQPRSRNVSSLR